MNKKQISAAALALIFGASAINAQQLKNSGFETWVDCTPWNSANTTTKQGTTPDGWCVSNVVTPKLSLGNATIATKITGKSGNAVQLKNLNKIGQIIPGYMALGKTWATAKISGTKPAEGTTDGGCWGGAEFNYRPDAISFDYIRTLGSGSTQPATINAYLWKGSTLQKDVPAMNGLNTDPVKVDMTNRDRNILGMTTALGSKEVTKSSDFELIATLEHKITSANSDWANLVIPFEYVSNSNPGMINIIFSAGDYFADRSAHKANDALSVDNVKMVYYSRLSALKLNGSDVNGFAHDKYEYTVDIPYSADHKFEASHLGKTSTHTVSFNDADYTATINVQGVHNDIDDQAEHSYIVKFAAPAVTEIPVAVDTETYEGLITVDLGGDPQALPDNYYVNITSKGEGKCDFSLNNFSLGDGNDMGDIKVTDVKTFKTAENSTDINITGSAKNITLVHPDLGNIVADVEIEGVLNAEKLLAMQIHVNWVVDPENDPNHENVTPIEVTFNGQPKAEPKIPVTVVSSTFKGNITVDLGDDPQQLDGTYYVNINNTDNEEGKCSVSLNHFTLGDGNDMGNIVVPAVESYKTSESDSNVHFAGCTNNVKLSHPDMGDIIADVVVEGVRDAEDNLSMLIHVNWVTDPENDPNHENVVPIEVTFNGKYDATATTIITVDKNETPRWYLINGMEVSEPTAAGIYIKRTGNKVEKIVKK